jgi:hypothetical protein
MLSGAFVPVACVGDLGEGRRDEERIRQFLGEVGIVERFEEARLEPLLGLIDRPLAYKVGESGVHQHMSHVTVLGRDSGRAARG